MRAALILAFVALSLPAAIFAFPAPVTDCHRALGRDHCLCEQPVRMPDSCINLRNIVSVTGCDPDEGDYVAKLDVVRVPSLPGNRIRRVGPKPNCTIGDVLEVGDSVFMHPDRFVLVYFEAGAPLSLAKSGQSVVARDNFSFIAHDQWWDTQWAIVGAPATRHFLVQNPFRAFDHDIVMNEGTNLTFVPHGEYHLGNVTFWPDCLSTGNWYTWERINGTTYGTHRCPDRNNLPNDVDLWPNPSTFNQSDVPFRIEVQSLPHRGALFQTSTMTRILNVPFILDPSGLVTYVPAPFQHGNGPDFAFSAFAFAMKDPLIEFRSASASAYIHVRPVNDPPSLGCDPCSLDVLSDVDPTKGAEFRILFSDPDTTFFEDYYQLTIKTDGGPSTAAVYLKAPKLLERPDVYRLAGDGENDLETKFITTYGVMRQILAEPLRLYAPRVGSGWVRVTMEDSYVFRSAFANYPSRGTGSLSATFTIEYVVAQNPDDGSATGASSFMSVVILAGILGGVALCVMWCLWLVIRARRARGELAKLKKLVASLPTQGV